MIASAAATEQQWETSEQVINYIFQRFNLLLDWYLNPGNAHDYQLICC